MAGRSLAARLPGRRTSLLALAALLVIALVAVGLVVWKSRPRGGLEEALGVVPAASLRVGYTDWAQVRRTLGADFGRNPQRSDVERFVKKAYDSDLGAVSSIDEAAGALQQSFGFSPGTADWEAYAQSRAGATMVLKVGDADFDVLAGHLRDLGYTKPSRAEGVWKGGIDLVSAIDPTISPELQYVALLADQHLVVTSDTSSYAAKAAAAALGDAPALGGRDSIDELEGALDQPANAILWSGDFACEDLAMSHADDDAQTQAVDAVKAAGGVDPLTGLAMSMSADRTLNVVEEFADSGQARDNLRPRAKLAVGEAIGRGGSFADDLRLTSSKASGPTVRLRFRPKEKTGFVLSSVYEGPVLFATC